MDYEFPDQHLLVNKLSAYCGQRNGYRQLLTDHHLLQNAFLSRYLPRSLSSLETSTV